MTEPTGACDDDIVGRVVTDRRQCDKSAARQLGNYVVHAGNSTYWVRNLVTLDSLSPSTAFIPTQHPSENLIHVPQVALDVEDSGDFLRRQVAADVGVALD